MTHCFEIILPVPPSDNELYFNTPGGQRGSLRIPTKEHKAWKKEAGTLLNQSNIPRDFDKTFRWRIEGVLYVPKGSWWRWDLTNRWKLLIDVLSKHLGVDDRYLMVFKSRKICGEDNEGKVLVNLYVSKEEKTQNLD